MDNNKYITVAILENIVQAIPTSIISDTVSIEIKRLSDEYTWNFSVLEFQNASNTGSMTFISGELWKQSFTPPTADTYIVTIENETLDVKYYLIYQAVGIAPTVSSALIGVAVYEKDLVAKLAREVGDIDTDNLYYTSAQLFSAINDGIDDYNEEMPQRVEIVGSGDAAYINPKPNTIDQRLMVIYSARALLRGELARQAREAIVHSNVAGRTDMSARPQWTDAALKRYDKKITALKLERKKQLVQDEMYTKGASMELKNKESGTGIEGLPITTIEHTV